MVLSIIGVALLFVSAGLVAKWCMSTAPASKGANNAVSPRRDLLPARRQVGHDSLYAKQGAAGTKIKRRIRMNVASSAMPLDPALDNECINTLRLCFDQMEINTSHVVTPVSAS